MKATLSFTLLGFVLACSSGDSQSQPRPELSSGAGGIGGSVVTVTTTGQGGTGGAGASAAAGGMAGAGGDGGEAGAGAGSNCMDMGAEPNETEAMATLSPTVDDCDSDAKMLAGVLDGPNDVDWYTYKGFDVGLCVVDPEREVTADGTLRICKFAECDEGAITDVTCEDGSTAALSPGGRDGCCHTQSFGIDVDCDGTDDDADVFIRFDQADAACVNYSATIHY